jgi:hypothetical protein
MTRGIKRAECRYNLVLARSPNYLRIANSWDCVGPFIFFLGSTATVASKLLAVAPVVLQQTVSSRARSGHKIDTTFQKCSACPNAPSEGPSRLQKQDNSIDKSAVSPQSRPYKNFSRNGRLEGVYFAYGVSPRSRFFRCHKIKPLQISLRASY